MEGEHSYKRKMSEQEQYEAAPVEGAPIKKPREGESCHRCGGYGHLSARCTSPKGSNDLCHNCGGFGHIIALCPSPKGAKLACHVCGGKGHQARSCPNNGHQQLEACYVCQTPGHFARNCPNQMGQMGQMGMAGMGMGRGQMANFMAQASYGMGFPQGGQGGGAGAGQLCYRCAQPGHLSRDCPQHPARSGCYRCGISGHMARDCPTPLSVATEPSVAN